MSLQSANLQSDKTQHIISLDRPPEKFLNSHLDNIMYMGYIILEINETRNAYAYDYVYDFKLSWCEGYTVDTKVEKITLLEIELTFLCEQIF